MARANLLLILLLAPLVSLPQDLVITNGRIVDGTGRIIDQGTIVVADGRIESVLEGVQEFVSGMQVDANGMTVMPGLIDTHRHLLNYSLRDWFPSDAGPDPDLEEHIRLEIVPVLDGLLENGLTTVLSAADLVPEIFDIRRQLQGNEYRGPRVLTLALGFTGPDDWAVRVCGENVARRPDCMIEETDPTAARSKVRELANAGVDGIKAIYDRTIVPDVILDDAVLRAVMDEAARLGLLGMVHAETADDMVRVVELGARRLVHTPHTGAASDVEGGRILRESGVAIATTVSYSSPQFAAATKQEYSRAEQHEQQLENIRYLWDEGVVVAFGTDNPVALGATEFLVEAEQLSKVLTPAEIILSMTRNAAIFVGLEDQIGTLEQGRVADILLVSGDPLTHITDLANVEVVVQGGRVVVDNR